MLVEIPDLLRKDRGGQVVWRVLTRLKHAFLAVVYRTSHIEHARWDPTVLHEVFGLGLILREVIEEDSRGRLVSEVLD